LRHHRPTQATRAGITRGLKAQDFLIADGKHIVPTERGLALFTVLERAPDQRHTNAPPPGIDSEQSNGRGKTRRKVAVSERKVSIGKPRAKQPGQAAAEHGSAGAPGGDTPLRIPFGNKEAALQLGARYRSGGWYAPAGIDLNGFRERGWL
jgi:DNA topoisomerase III